MRRAVPLRNPPCPFEIGADDPGPVVLGDLEDGGRTGDAGVVHEDVGHPERILNRIEPGLHAGRVGDIHPDRMGFAASVANLVRKGLEPLDAPRRQRHGCAVRGQGPGEVPAEAARCPGHERGAAGQVEMQSLRHGVSVTGKLHAP